MRAAVLERFGDPLEVQEVDLAEPRAGEVLVRLVACGVCHTDLYTASGADPSGYAPTVLGHEGAGVVDTIGSSVSTLRPGDRVVASWVAPCEHCYWCIGGQTETCAEWPHPAVPRFRRDDGSVVQSGMGTLGTFADAMIVDERALVAVATDLPDEQLALIGCGVTTGVCAVFNAAAGTVIAASTTPSRRRGIPPRPSRPTPPSAAAGRSSSSACSRPTRRRRGGCASSC